VSVIIDSSVWLEYFRKGNNSEKVDFLIDEDLIVTNDLILAELTPFLMMRKQEKLLKLLHNINKLAIKISWDQLVDFQCSCLQNGLNGVGIPDLIIVQNAIQNDSQIYSLDKHFTSMSAFLDVEIF